MRHIPLLLVLWLAIGCQQAPSEDVALQTLTPTAANNQPVGRGEANLRVTVDGQSVSPQLQYAGGNGEGDKQLINVGITLVLNANGAMEFKWKGAAGELLYLETSGQSPRLVGVKVLSTYDDDRKVLVNPLAGLSEAEMRGLWGIEVDHWSDAIAEKLKQVEPKRTCVTIRENATVGSAHSLPPLPDGLSILQIESRSSDGFKDFQELRNLKRLTFLAIRTVGRAPVDCSLLNGAIELTFLNLSGNTLKQSEELGALAQLKVLEASYCQGLKNISFAKSMRNLETLDVSHTEVSDLSPLGGLPQLRSVNANMTAVRKLPGAIASLRELSVLTTKATDADVRVFRDANPQCEVRHRWGQSLLGALKPSTRLRVRSGGTCHRDETSEQTLFETDKLDEIKQLLGGIAIAEDDSGFHCMCCGDPSFEFYEDDRLILTLGFHHGMGLRWPGGWPGDAALTPASATFMIDWLAKRNVSGPSDERATAAEQERIAERKVDRATQGMSPALAKAFKTGPEAFKAALNRELPERGSQAEVWLRIFGTSNDSWTSLEAVEQLADQQLREFDQKTLEAQVEKALLGNDRQLRRGAARLWRSRRSSLEEWNPPNIGRLHSIVLQIQQEARYYPLRMNALDGLARWKDDLTESEINERIAAGLHDPAPQVRRKAMLTAGRLRHTDSVDTLMDVLKGEDVEVHPLPEVPSWEEQDVPGGFGDVAEGSSDKEVAALALAYLGHVAARPIIETQQPGSPMYDVALALLGDGSRLKAEHFASKSGNQELQLAAVGAVIRSKGTHGLELALGYQQASHWWEEEYVVAELSRMLQEENAPGSKMLADCKTLTALKQWFAEHGAEYLQQMETSPGSAD